MSSTDSYHYLNIILDNDIQNYRGYYTHVMYSDLVDLGIDVVAKDMGNQGGIDFNISPNQNQTR